MALLMPDPCDPHCPDEFKAQARELLLGMRGRPSGWDSVIQTDEGLRQILLKFIADFANWDNAAKTEYLEISRGLVKAAHPEETPTGGGPLRRGRIYSLLKPSGWDARFSPATSTPSPASSSR